ncbi:hypothetical protein FHG87_022214 [Trinorchestia longiramus]|nr:hypothetical protein FHG87_022214 [Trinorchestia longiramus]
MFLERSAYTKALLFRFGMDKANSVATPVDINADLVTTSDEVEDCDKDLYQSAVDHPFLGAQAVAEQQSSSSMSNSALFVMDIFVCGNNVAYDSILTDIFKLKINSCPFCSSQSQASASRGARDTPSNPNLSSPATSSPNAFPHHSPPPIHFLTSPSFPPSPPSPPPTDSSDSNSTVMVSSIALQNSPLYVHPLRPHRFYPRNQTHPLLNTSPFSLLFPRPSQETTWCGIIYKLIVGNSTATPRLAQGVRVEQAQLVGRARVVWRFRVGVSEKRLRLGLPSHHLQAISKLSPRHNSSAGHRCSGPQQGPLTFPPPISEQEQSLPRSTSTLFFQLLLGHSRGRYSYLT